MLHTFCAVLALFAFPVSAANPLRAPAAAGIASPRTAEPVITRVTLTRTLVPGDRCTAPASEGTFLTTDREVVVVYTYRGGAKDDKARFEWIAPTGRIFSSGFTHPADGGSWCASGTLNVAGFEPAALPGAWILRLRWNDVEVYSAPFEILSPPASTVQITSGSVLPVAVTGKAYSYSFSATGGTPPYGWSVAEGALPPGFTLSETGTLAGTGSGPGSYNLRITARDSAAASVTRGFGFGISVPDVSFGARSLSFTHIPGEDAPLPQDLTVSSTGSAVAFTLKAVSEGNWLAVSPASATAPAQLAVSVETRGLSPGKHEGSIEYRTEFNRSGVLPVSLLVERPDSPSRIRALISTFAGNDWLYPFRPIRGQETPLSRSVSLAAGLSGDILIADRDNYVVVRRRPDGTSQVIAGNGVRGFSGNGGPATLASLNDPLGIASDSAGNVYLSDAGNHVIRRITTAGVIDTVAGSGIRGFAGDDGPALSARLDRPSHLVVDAFGRLIFVDSGNESRIRRVGADGVITTLTIAKVTVDGLAVDAGGNVYYSTWADHRIRRVTLAGTVTIYAGTGAAADLGEGGPATAAGLRNPSGLGFDAAGNLYFSETGAYRVRRIDPSGMLTTFAGSVFGDQSDGQPPSQARFQFLSSLAVDSAQNVFVFDYSISRVSRVTSSLVTTELGNGGFRNATDGTSAVSSFLYQPRGIAFDSSGALLVADTIANRIRKILPDGTQITIAGTGLYGCCRDGQPAITAFFRRPAGIAVDRSGTIYVADTENHSVRRIDSRGIIHQVAGSGEAGFAGDGGPAAKAVLNSPHGLAFDSAGNLLVADAGNQRIRQIATDGAISTIAGNGTPGSGGDGGAAVDAELRTPQAIALDHDGALYIADLAGDRVRRVKAGVITTFAGNGKNASDGNGGAAADASIDGPSALVADARGNIYIAESQGSRIRRVDPNGIIITLAGNGRFAFSGDGGLASDAAFNGPSGGLAFDSAGNLYVSDTGNHRIRVVRPSIPSIRTSKDSLQFHSRRSLVAELLIDSNSPGLPYNSSVVTATGGNWLRVLPPAGVLPADLRLSADPSGLEAGNYRATVTISTPFSDPARIRIPVVFEVTGEPARLSADVRSLSFNLQQGSGPSSQPVRVTNASSEGATLSVTPSGGAWLSVTAGADRVSADSPSFLTVVANPAGLQPGTYSGSFTVSGGSGDPLRIPVALIVSRPQPVILVSQTGLTFRAVSRGGLPLPQTVGVLNVGRGQLNWTAVSSTLSGGPGWLRLGSAGGSIRTPFTEIADLAIRVDAGALEPGDYYGRVEVRAPGADNSPQVITVLLQVLPPGSRLGPEVNPTGVIFVGGAGLSPGAQRVSIGNTSAEETAFTSNNQTFDGAVWMTHAPQRSNVGSRQPAEVVIQPSLDALAPGVRNGVVTFLFKDGVTRDVKVLTVVPPGDSQTAKESARGAGENCSPTSIKLNLSNLRDSFSVRPGEPTPFEVQVFDNCGKPLTRDRGAAVSVGFAPQPDTLTLNPLNEGKWSKTWRPRRSAAGERSYVTASVTAFLPVQNGKWLADQADVTVEIQPEGAAPQIDAGGILNSASYAVDAPVAPGTLVAIYGRNLAASTGSASGASWPTELGGAEVRLGDRSLPISYASDRQINAVIPLDVPVNTAQQLVIRRGAIYSTPEAITVAAAQPAVFAVNQQGSGQAVARNAATGTLAGPQNPLRAGDTVELECTGLGAVRARNVEGVEVSIGGKPARVTSASLADAPGKYTVHAVVPAGLTAGDAVSLTVSVAGQTSPAVTMAVR